MKRHFFYPKHSRITCLLPISLAFLIMFASQCEKAIEDEVPPEVVLVQPADGATVGDPNIVVIRALATDNEEVAKVEFYIDGELLEVDNTTPFEIEWNAGFWVEEKEAQHTISAIAIDAAGNQSIPDLITVTVTNIKPIIPSLIQPKGMVTDNNFQFI